MSLVSIRECAKEFRLSERHIRRMIENGRWPFYRLGSRAVRLDLEEIKASARRVDEKIIADGTHPVSGAIQPDDERGG